MAERRQVRLGDILRIKHGFAFSGEHFCDSPTRYSLVTPGNFAIGGGFKSVKKFYDGPLEEGYVLSVGDVLVTMTDLSKAGDTLGFSAVVPFEEKVTYLHNQRVGLVKIYDPLVSEPNFIHWVMRSAPYRQEILAGATGTTVRHTSPGRIEAYEFMLPPIDEQRAIAEVLGALDDKIESNRRLGNLLIQLARTMLETGENRVRLGDIATCDKGLSYRGDGLQENPSAGIPMVNLGNFGVDGWLNAEKLKFYSGEYKERHLLKAGDLVVANTDLTQQRVIIGRPALVPPSLGKAIFTHHVTAIRPLVDEKLRLPIWAQLNSPAFRERAEGFATGTTVAGMPVEALLDFDIRIPDGEVISDAQELLARVWVAESESRSLKQARDSLLPELLSGRLRVRDAESMVEGA